MMRWFISLLIVIISSSVWANYRVKVAQTEEPSSPNPIEQSGSTEEETEGTREPLGEEPDNSPEEPSGSQEDPVIPSGSDGEKQQRNQQTVSSEKTLYGAGIQLRGIFIPTWFLGLFLDASTGLNSVALGGEFVRRKGNFDIVASMNFGFYSPPDGNYLGNNDNPAVNTDYIQFRNLNLLSFDVAFIGHHYFLPWLSLVYGAGLGLGIVLGNIYRISNYEGRCNKDNMGNLEQCNPVKQTSDSAANAQEVAEWVKDPDGWIANNSRTCKLVDGKDSPSYPCLYREDDVWPVLPIIHLMLGVNFKISDQFSVRVDGGFHNAFYVGAAGHYFF